jgi:hypothetical protein
MFRVELRWWLWAVIAFVVLMLYKGPSEMVALAGGLLHAVDAAAGGMVKALHETQRCGSPCRPG